MSYFIEAMLALFWTSYLLLHWKLLRAPVNEANEINDSLQGELPCTTPAMK
jgi:hypothetical protein